MEREKMIEEMAKVTCGYKVHCRNCQKVHPSQCADRSFAAMFIDAGYRKVPDGAVVLTREEYESLRQSLTGTTNRECELADRARALLHECDVLKIDLDQARKETAKEILNEVSKHYGGSWLVALYKKYGVEVEE